MKKVNIEKFVQPKKLKVTPKGLSSQMYGVQIC